MERGLGVLPHPHGEGLAGAAPTSLITTVPSMDYHGHVFQDRNLSGVDLNAYLSQLEMSGFLNLLDLTSFAAW